MRLENIVHTIASTGQAERLADITASAIRHEPVRRTLVSYVDWRINRQLEKAYDTNGRRPPGVIQDRAHILRALLHSVDRMLAQGNVSEELLKKVLRGQVNLLMGLEPNPTYERFRREHNGYGPPGFVVISPGFVVISGGEPLAYHSQGKGILDAAAKHPDTLFLMYTNGTLIDEEMAARMAGLGNITPAISVEGWEERTDARRGKGIFQRVLRSMANLRQAGVAFGISLTATRENCEEILSDEFLDFFFEEQGALYGWIFQYMPIGRGFTLDLLPTPEQRAWMWERTWEVIRKKRYFLPDFWNLGTCTDGCISAGRQKGYLYFDWDGKVMPCVFVPYSPVNINVVYAQGGTLNDLLEEPFFKAIREWQDAYGYAATKPEECKNWTMPCPIRDHHADFRRILQATEPDPEDEAALQAMIDPAYRDGLIRYDEAVARLMDPIWEREYLGNGRQVQGSAKKGWISDFTHEMLGPVGL
jgi:hypothetical protein